MQTKTFRGKDKADIDQQVWEWRVDNPKIKVLDMHLIKQLPRELNPIRHFSKNHRDRRLRRLALRNQLHSIWPV
jgi:hypothetical protein